MQVLPIISYYLRHGSQIEALIAKGQSGPDTHLVLDLATALTPVLKKHCPTLNENNLLDDTLAMLKAALGPSTEEVISTESGAQIGG